LVDEKIANDFVDQIEDEEDDEILLTLDEETIEERQQMLALGLPQEFTSSRSLNKRSKRKKKNTIRNKIESKVDSIYFR